MNWFGLHIGKPKTIQASTPLTALAFFLGNPRGYKYKPWEQKAITAFKQSLIRCPRLTTDQMPVHGCYLINLASPKPDVVLKSQERFRAELQTCQDLGISRYVLHPGVNPHPSQGLKQLGDSLKLILPQYPSVNVLIENMTGTNKLCQTFEACRELLSYVQAPNLKFCLDTAHSWGAGMKMMTLLDDFDRVVGLQHLWAIHLNDSKAPYGSHRDLHQNIFEGEIPREFWYVFMLDPRLRNIPCILETPLNNHPRLQAFHHFFACVGVKGCVFPLPFSVAKRIWNYVY